MSQKLSISSARSWVDEPKPEYTWIDALLVIWGALYVLFGAHSLANFDPVSSEPIPITGTGQIWIPLVIGTIVLLVATRGTPALGYGLLGLFEIGNLSWLLFRGPGFGPETFVDAVPPEATAGVVVLNGAVAIVLIGRWLEIDALGAESDQTASDSDEAADE